MERNENRQPRDGVDPYRPPLPPSRRTTEPGRSSRRRGELIALIRTEERRARGWFALFLIGFIVGGMIRIAAVGPTAWSTWMINWHSNLCLYGALLGLALSIRHGVRSVIWKRKLKKLG